jgi:hypothetical protein
MPKRSSNPKKPPVDVNALARFLVDEATAERGSALPEEPSKAATKNPAAVVLGRLGGLRGGKARANVLSKERRREIAKKAASSRWKKPRA